MATRTRTAQVKDRWPHHVVSSPLCGTTPAVRLQAGFAVNYAMMTDCSTTLSSAKRSVNKYVANPPSNKIYQAGGGTHGHTEVCCHSYYLIKHKSTAARSSCCGPLQRLVHGVLTMRRTSVNLSLLLAISLVVGCSSRPLRSQSLLAQENLASVHKWSDPNPRRALRHADSAVARNIPIDRSPFTDTDPVSANPIDSNPGHAGIVTRQNPIDSNPGEAGFVTRMNPVDSNPGDAGIVRGVNPIDSYPGQAGIVRGINPIDSNPGEVGIVRGINPIDSNPGLLVAVRSANPVDSDPGVLPHGNPVDGNPGS